MKTTVRILCAALFAASTSAWAHSGHGQPEPSHWHATDAWGLLALGVGIAAALFFISRR